MSYMYLYMYCKWTDRKTEFIFPFVHVGKGRLSSSIQDTVLQVYNLQGGVLGFSHQRSGLGVVLSVSINSAPSKGPDTTLVPWKLTRMEAGTQYPWDSTATSYTPPPLAPPDRPESQSQNF